MYMKPFSPPALLSFCLGLGIALVPQPSAHAAVTIVPLGTYATGVFDEGAQEIAAHDPGTQRLFVVNANASTVDVLDISDPSSPTLIDTLDLTSVGNSANSVAIYNGVAAVAVQAEEKTDPGSVAFFDTETLDLLNVVPAGALPDMVTFSPDGHYVLVANEGEPDDDYAIDPEGSVSVIDVSAGIENATVSTAGFAAFNGQPLPGVRIFGPGASVAQDLEPEYIAVSADSATAWVTLQENNALGVIDIASATVTAIVPLGYKDHSLPGNGLDASNEDDAINIVPWPVMGMYLPDAIVAYEVDGHTYLITANEGDTRDYDGFSEETRVADAKIDWQFIRPDEWKKLLKEENLGRLLTTTAGGTIDGDKRKDMVLGVGARSFTIWDAATGAVVHDSGDEIEQVTAATHPDHFNASNTSNSFDNRSDDKGPEPEGVTIGEAFGITLAFIGLERMGGVMIYDVSNPGAPVLQDYVNNRNFDADPETPEAGDLGPEGLVFISASDSPIGEPLLVVANEISGTTTVYQVKQAE